MDAVRKPAPQYPIDATVQRRLDALESLIDREYEGSAKVFEARTGVKMAQLAQWYSGYRALRDKALRRLEGVTRKPEGYFDANPDPPTGAQQKTSRGIFEILQYDTGGGMGRGIILRDQPGLIRGWKVTDEWITKNVHNLTAPGNLAIVTGFGDSMRPLYNPGDPLLVDCGVKDMRFDAVYFFRVGEEGFVKRLQRIPGNGILAISENRSYRDWTITPEMDFEVFARVIKVWRGEDF